MLPALALLALLALAVAVSIVLTRLYGAPEKPGRFSSIDGMRGYLAFFVYVHHGAIWYYYLRSNEWAPPPSRFYAFLGQGSVAMFFMITAFLFTGKMVNAKDRSVDWIQLYSSRVTRLVPLYVVSVALLFFVVAVLSDWRRQVSLLFLARTALTWVAFSVFGEPDLNRVLRTFTINAGVTWSLPYEWYFYALLPLLGTIKRVKTPRWLVLASTLIGIAGIMSTIQPLLLLPFLGGMAASAVQSSSAVQRFASTTTASLVVIGTVTLAATIVPSANHPVAVILLSIAFTLIACGNTLFGALVAPASRKLGETAYSMYLLHGLLLFVAFRFVLGIQLASALSPLQHWAVIAALTPLIICASLLSFVKIEAPAMRWTPTLTERLRGSVGRARP